MERTITPANAVRVSQQTTLFDGKLIGRPVLDNEMWTTALGGAATMTFADENSVLMTVTGNGDYAIYESNRFLPYFSGKPQDIEGTFDFFHVQAGVIKRFGYFSSNAIVPYNSLYDGFWIESNGVDNKIYIKSSRMGTITTEHTVDLSSASMNYRHDWEKFSVVLFTFLWLGGAALDLAVAIGSDIVKIIETSVVGKINGTICKYPHQPIRYEIRSVGGAGTFRAICNMVATGGSINESGRGRIVRNVADIACNNVGTNYVLAAIRKNALGRYNAILITSIEAAIAATSDAGIITLHKNPTISGGTLTWATAPSGEYDQAFGNGTLAVSADGTVIESKTLTTSGVGDANLRDNFMAWLTQNINDSADVFVLSYTPMTSNQVLRGVIHTKVY